MRFLYCSHKYDLLLSPLEQQQQLSLDSDINTNKPLKRRRRKMQQSTEWTLERIPTWLYKLHNEISKHLLTKKAKKLYGCQPTMNELRYAQWSTTDACLLCYNDYYNHNS